MGPNTIFIEMVPVMVPDSSIVFINGKIQQQQQQEEEEGDKCALLGSVTSSQAKTPSNLLAAVEREETCL